MDVIQKAICREFKKEILKAQSYFGAHGNHFLIVGPEDYILNVVVEILIRYAAELNISPVFLENSTQRHDKSNTLYILRIDKSLSISYQTLLYYYLELSVKNSIYLLLVSDSCMCVDNLEKRVKSRFNHQVVFFPFLSYNSYSKLHKQLLAAPIEDASRMYSMNKSIEWIVQRHHAKKLGFDDYILLDLYKLLSTTHVVLLIISVNKRIRFNSCVFEFGRSTSSVPELRNTKNMDILQSFYDLIDANLINSVGEFAGDLELLRQFVSGCMPTFVKSLFKQNMKL